MLHEKKEINNNLPITKCPATISLNFINTNVVKEHINTIAPITSDKSPPELSAMESSVDLPVKKCSTIPFDAT